MIEPHHTPTEIAKALRKDVHYVLNLIASGELTARNLGKGMKRPRYVVAESALQRFLESRETGPPTPAPRRRQRRPKPAATIDYVAMMRLGGKR